jgi:hypothetical protein
MGSVSRIFFGGWGISKELIHPNFALLTSAGGRLVLRDLRLRFGLRPVHCNEDMVAAPRALHFRRRRFSDRGAAAVGLFLGRGRRRGPSGDHVARLRFAGFDVVGFPLASRCRRWRRIGAVVVFVQRCVVRFVVVVFVQRCVVRFVVVGLDLVPGRGRRRGLVAAWLGLARAAVHLAQDAIYEEALLLLLFLLTVVVEEAVLHHDPTRAEQRAGFIPDDEGEGLAESNLVPVRLGRHEHGLRFGFAMPGPGPGGSLLPLPAAVLVAQQAVEVPRPLTVVGHHRRELLEEVGGVGTVHVGIVDERAGLDAVLDPGTEVGVDELRMARVRLEERTRRLDGRQRRVCHGEGAAELEREGAGGRGRRRL